MVYVRRTPPGAQLGCRWRREWSRRTVYGSRLGPRCRRAVPGGEGARVRQTARITVGIRGRGDDARRQPSRPEGWQLGPLARRLVRAGVPQAGGREVTPVDELRQAFTLMR